MDTMTRYMQVVNPINSVELNKLMTADETEMFDWIQTYTEKPSHIKTMTKHVLSQGLPHTMAPTLLMNDAIAIIKFVKKSYGERDDS